MSRAVKVMLAEPLAEQLEELAAGAQEPASTVAAQILRHGLAQAVKRGKVRALAPAEMPASARRSDTRPPWLEPYGGDPEWTAITWGAIVALHGRYPEELSALKDGWWERSSQFESLAALAVWRQEIDDHGQDPREELAFQGQLSTLSEILQRQRGSVRDTWEPGFPPAGWGA